jgi:hypothetical protein
MVQRRDVDVRGGRDGLDPVVVLAKGLDMGVGGLDVLVGLVVVVLVLVLVLAQTCP